MKFKCSLHYCIIIIDTKKTGIHIIRPGKYNYIVIASLNYKLINLHHLIIDN